MSTKYEALESGDNGNLALSVYYRGQSFTPSIAHKITSVKLYLYRLGSPGSFSVFIRATDVNGKPTGSNLCYGQTDGNTLPTEAPYEWREILLGGGTNLTVSTKYAIVTSPSTTGDLTTNLVYWRRRSGGAYAGGAQLNDDTDGETWATPGTTVDQLFSEWGDPIGAVVSTLNCTSIIDTTATGNGNISSIGNSSITQHGHCWATTVNPTTSSSKTSNGVGSLGTFTSSITGLTPGVKYYVRAYVTNTEGTFYGANVTFVADYGSTQMGSGNIAIVESRLHYIDAYGVERYSEGTEV